MDMISLNESMPDLIYNTAMFVAPVLMFAIGVIGLVWYRYDIIRLFIALELMILAVNVFFVQISFVYTNVQLSSQVVVPIVLAVAACEAAIGLGLLVVAYRVKGTISFGSLNRLKG
jgi:NADH-quinone oxidoreductase subunit K